jgi:hypothetical protein
MYKYIYIYINMYKIPGYDGYKITTYPKTVVANVYWYLCFFINTVTMNYVVQVLMIMMIIVMIIMMITLVIIIILIITIGIKISV